MPLIWLGNKFFLSFLLHYFCKWLKNETAKQYCFNFFLRKSFIRGRKGLNNGSNFRPWQDYIGIPYSALITQLSFRCGDGSAAIQDITRGWAAVLTEPISSNKTHETPRRWDQTQDEGLWSTVSTAVSSVLMKYVSCLLK